MKIGELGKATGLTTKTIWYYELHRLLETPPRTVSGYRFYGPENLERLEFIKKGKRLGFSLEEIREILVLHRQRQVPCVHVLARVREESQARLEQLPEEARICGIIEGGIHAKGEVALAWLAGRGKGS